MVHKQSGTMLCNIKKRGLPWFTAKITDNNHISYHQCVMTIRKICRHMENQHLCFHLHLCTHTCSRQTINGLILPRWAIHIWLHWKYYLRCGLVPGVMYGCFQVLCRAENSNQNNLCSLQRRGHEATSRLLVVKSATAVITTGIFQKG